MYLHIGGTSDAAKIWTTYFTISSIQQLNPSKNVIPCIFSIHRGAFSGDKYGYALPHQKMKNGCDVKLLIDEIANLSHKNPI